MAGMCHDTTYNRASEQHSVRSNSYTHTYRLELCVKYRACPIVNFQKQNVIKVDGVALCVEKAVIFRVWRGPAAGSGDTISHVPALGCSPPPPPPPAPTNF